MIEEDRIEEIVEECQEVLEADPDRFSAWERDFIESIEEQNEQGHLTTLQLDKLMEIYQDKVLG